MIVLGDHDFLLRVSNFGDLAAFRAILAIFSMRMRRSSYLWVSGENFDTGIRFLDPDFFIWNSISAIWRCFLLIFAFGMLNNHRTSTYGLLDLRTDLGSVSRVSPLTVKIIIKFEVDRAINCL